MPYLTLKCPCGASVRRHDSKVKEGKTYYCSRVCMKAETERPDGTYKCSSCGEWLSRESYRWYSDTRYSAGERRQPYCIPCTRDKTRLYHADPERKTAARHRHDRWRERNLTEGGDVALRWYFARQKGGYAKRARTQGVPFDLEPDYLVGLFHQQKGLCYYSGVEMDWDSYGKGHATSESMSVDRLDPQKGYVKGNVVLCTYLMNTTKGSRTEQEFYEICRQVLGRSQGRQ